MIYIYNAEVLASLRNRSLGWYNEYTLLSHFMNPSNVYKTLSWAGLNGIFYFYIHEMYDPLFLWNIEETKQLKIELGNHRYLGRAIRAQQTSKEMWLPTKIVSPIPWEYVLADIRVQGLDKTIDIEFPSAELFKNNVQHIIVEGKFYDRVVKPYLKFPNIVDKMFGRLDLAYGIYVDKHLSNSYVLKNKDMVIGILGNKNYLNAKEYDINDYGGFMDTVSAMFMDAEKEIK
jgi:hypothetical protein